MKSIKRQVLKILFILLVVICITSSVYAVQITKEEYSKEYQEYLELDDEEKKKVLEPRKFNIEVEKSYSEYLKSINNKLRVTQLLRGSSLGKYNLRTQIADNVKVRNQMQTNTCWAFATIGALESNLALTNKLNNQEVEVYDYSERHMAYASTRASFKNSQINEKGYNISVSDGGTFYMAQSYLTNGSGAVTESQMVFENNEEPIDIASLKKTVSTELIDTVEFPEPSNNTEKAEVMAQMKSHITNYGGIYAGVHGAGLMSEFYHNPTGALYCNSTYNSNGTKIGLDHAVLIVGWDDGFEKENFKPDRQPINDGAWIIKNSWGESITESLSEFKQTLYDSNISYCNSQGWNSAEEIPNSKVIEVLEKNGWGEKKITIDEQNDRVICEIGDNGFMYVSYEDIFIYKSLFGIQNAKDAKEYKNIYQNDLLGMSNVLSINLGINKPLYLANVFTRNSSVKEALTAVSVYTKQGYTCKVYVNPTGSDKTNLQEVELAAGETESFEAGYHTLEFAEPVELTGNSFVVAIEITNNSSSKEVAIEQPVAGTFYEYAVVNANESFYSLDKTTWTDFATLEDAGLRGNVLIKGLTKDVEVTEPPVEETIELQSIKITKAPTKLSYAEGENFSATGMVVKAVYSNADEKEITTYNIVNGTNLKQTQTSVTISYTEDGITKTAQQTITVGPKAVTKIEIAQKPTKLKYTKGVDTLDLTGGKIKVTYTNGTTEQIDMKNNDVKVTGFNNSAIGKNVITLTYKGKTTTFEVDIVAPQEVPNDNPTQVVKQLQSIKITNKPTKTTYIEGESFSSQGMVVKAVYNNADEKEITTYNVTNGTNLKQTQTSVTISYTENGITKTVQQTITVNPKTVSKIEVSQKPNKLQYIKDTESLDLTGGKIKVTYSNGTSEEIDMKNAEVKVTGFNNSAIGKNVITLTYKGKTTTFEVQIIENKIKENAENLIDLQNTKALLVSYEGSLGGENSYSIIKIKVTNIKIKELKSEYKYYYYISGTQGDKNIDEKYWVEINKDAFVKAADGTYSVDITIDSRTLKNAAQIANSDNLYVYIKEVTNTGNTKMDSFQVTLANNLEDDDKIDEIINNSNNNNGNNVQTGDNTTAGGKLPQTGIVQVTLIIFAIIAFAGFSYYRYKNIDK